MQKGSKILLFSNTAWYLYNFRLAFAQNLQKQGYMIVFASPRDPHAEKIQAAGFRFHEINLDRHGINPFKDIKTILSIRNLLKLENPEIIHNFTIKCILYGSIAALLAGTPRIINSITGLGHIFINKNIKAKILRFFISKIYKILFSFKHVRVLFQNLDDLNHFVFLKIIPKNKAHLIQGSGIDLARFQPCDEPINPSVLLAGRLLKEKGIYEFVEAAKKLRKYKFMIAGSLDPSQPSSIQKEELDEWIALGIITYLGHVDKIEDAIKNATIVVLPSYREGLPRILLEAAAMGRATIATDVPGCRLVVKNNETGVLIPPENAEVLSNAIEDLMSNAEKRKRFSKASIEYVKKFSIEKIANETLALYTKPET